MLYFLAIMTKSFLHIFLEASRFCERLNMILINPSSLILYALVIYFSLFTDSPCVKTDVLSWGWSSPEVIYLILEIPRFFISYTSTCICIWYIYYQMIDIVALLCDKFIWFLLLIIIPVFLFVFLIVPFYSSTYFHYVAYHPWYPPISSYNYHQIMGFFS